MQKFGLKAAKGDGCRGRGGGGGEGEEEEENSGLFPHQRGEKEVVCWEGGGTDTHTHTHKAQDECVGVLN